MPLRSVVVWTLAIMAEPGADESHIARSDTPVGRMVIERVNDLLGDRDFRAVLQAPDENWARLTSLH